MENIKLEKFKQSVRGKNIAVLGIGVSNTPLIEMLAAYGAFVTACDQREDIGESAGRFDELGVKTRLGGDYLRGLAADIIFKTPGMRFDLPELLTAAENGAEITSEMEVFFDLCPCKIIGITGSDGKTTTTTLIAKMLTESGKTVHLGGNIGKPLLPMIEKIGADDYCVAELSSFQLHTMRKSPEIAVVTNITPNHLDKHRDMDEYIGAKTNIFKYQTPDSLLVLNRDNPVTKSFIGRQRGKLRLFSKNRFDGEDNNISSPSVPENDVYVENGQIVMAGEKIMRTSDIILPGAHNVENYMAAIAAVRDIVSSEIIKKVANTFGGVEHRIEFVRELGGVKYYNDSASSSPARTRVGLYSFAPKRVVLIAGGYDKGIPFDTLGEDIRNRVKALVLIGATAGDIEKAVREAFGNQPPDLPIIHCKTLDQAVLKARAQAREGDAVLFSPACASFDMFTNFAVRGDCFRGVVEGLGL